MRPLLTIAALTTSCRCALCGTRMNAGEPFRWFQDRVLVARSYNTGRTTHRDKFRPAHIKCPVAFDHPPIPTKYDLEWQAIINDALAAQRMEGR